MPPPLELDIEPDGWSSNSHAPSAWSVVVFVLGAVFAVGMNWLKDTATVTCTKAPQPNGSILQSCQRLHSAWPTVTVGVAIAAFTILSLRFVWLTPGRRMGEAWTAFHAGESKWRYRRLLVPILVAAVATGLLSLVVHAFAMRLAEQHSRMVDRWYYQQAVQPIVDSPLNWAGAVGVAVLVTLVLTAGYGANNDATQFKKFRRNYRERRAFGKKRG